MQGCLPLISQFLDNLKSVGFLDHSREASDPDEASTFADLSWHEELGSFCGTPAFYDLHACNSRVTLSLIFSKEKFFDLWRLAYFGCFMCCFVSKCCAHVSSYCQICRDESWHAAEGSCIQRHQVLCWKWLVSWNSFT